MDALLLRNAIFAAGVGQLALAAASLALPRVLGWREDTARLKPLTRQVFWTYAGYIWAANLSFGLLSSLAPSTMLDGSLLATALCGYIALYWTSRLAIQFFVFDRSKTKEGRLFQLAEVALTSLFVFLVTAYGTAMAWNLGWIAGPGMLTCVAGAS